MALSGKRRSERGALARNLRSLLCAGVCMAALVPGSANAISLKAAIKIALEANPEIGEAIANREAQEFELKQARGLYLPKADVEARYGAQRFSSPGTRAAQNSNETFDRREVRGTITQRIFDGFNRRGERHHQAGRVDGASHRVYARAEEVAFNVTREYLEAGRLMKIVQLSEENIAYHRRILGDLKEGETGGSISVADRQQAEERVFAAEARLIEASEDLNAAKIRFFRLVGMPLDHYQHPGGVAGALPGSLSAALGVARTSNSEILAAKSDVDAARALITKARSEYLPKLDVEVLGRQGYDLDAVPGRESEWRAELVMRWNIFKGGIDRANVQEQLRVTDEERHSLRKAHRQVEQEVRLAWDRRMQQSRRLNRLRDQLVSTQRLRDSYSEQFKVGDRSLLDLLDNQNTLYNTQIGVETAQKALELAEYRVLFATGTLLAKLNIQAPEQSDPYASAEHRVPATPPGETDKRMKPGHRWFTRGSR